MKLLDVELGMPVSHVIKMPVLYIEANYSFEVFFFRKITLIFSIRVHFKLCDILKK